MIPAIILAAFWVMWTPDDVQIGIADGPKNDGHLMMLIPAEGCSAGVKVYTGRYGDMDRAVAKLANSKVCDLVEKRAAVRNVHMAEMKAFAESHPWYIVVGPGKIEGERGNSMEFDREQKFGQFADEAECQKALQAQANGVGPFTTKHVPVSMMSCRI